MVNLQSTQNRSASVDEETSKPQIIFSYNETKGAVNTLDHLILLQILLAAKKTPRWTTNVLFFIPDVAAYNTFVLFSMKNP